MKHLKTFESFQINEEEEIIGNIKSAATAVKKTITGEASDEKRQEKIKKYTEELLAGTVSEELKKDFKKYIDAKPTQGTGSSMGHWLTYVTNVDDWVKGGLEQLQTLVKNLKEAKDKSKVTLEDAFGKVRPAIDVIEEEVARMIIKDRLVTKSSGKWEGNEKGRSFSVGSHSFGSGE